MPPDGSCPTCGEIIADPPDTKVPWHFWTLLVAVVAYLGFRLVQGIALLLEDGEPWWAAALALASVGFVGGSVWWWRTGRSDNDEAEGDDHEVPAP